MKKLNWLFILTALVLMLGSIEYAHAEIIPPYGDGQIGFHAAILCEELTLREKPSFSSKAVQTLNYGDFIIVTEQQNGWARCVLSDSEDAVSGWVNSEFIVIDPAWYKVDKKTPVYAWNDTNAPKVALLDINTELFDSDTFLPVLKTEGDWILVSLRGAAGWIYTDATN